MIEPVQTYVPQSPIEVAKAIAVEAELIALQGYIEAGIPDKYPFPHIALRLDNTAVMWVEAVGILRYGADEKILTLAKQLFTQCVMYPILSTAVATRLMEDAVHIGWDAYLEAPRALFWQGAFWKLTGSLAWKLQIPQLS